jgi:hypothetical protein
MLVPLIPTGDWRNDEWPRKKCGLLQISDINLFWMGLGVKTLSFSTNIFFSNTLRIPILLKKFKADNCRNVTKKRKHH